MSNSGLDQIDTEHERGADQDPSKLIPVEKGHAAKRRLEPIIEGDPQHREKRDEEEKARPIALKPAPCLFACHGAVPPPRSCKDGGSLLKASRFRDRSEERRVGKECRARWSTDH